MRANRPSRRELLVAAGAGAVLASLPACSPDGNGRLGEGGLDAGGGNGSGGSGGNGSGGNGTGGNGTGGNGSTGGKDGGVSGGEDMATAPGDLAHGTNCKAGSIDAGAASSYAVGGTPKLIQSGFSEVFVLRDAGGLFAVSASCTHSGCPCQVQGSQYYCPCHGATFAWDGSKPTLPAVTPLKHYAMCVDASGNATVDPGTTVPASTRY